MKAGGSQLSLQCGKGYSASLGAGASVAPTNGRIITSMVGSVSGLKLQIRDQPGVSQASYDTANQWSGTADQPMAGFSVACDGASVHLKNSAGVAMSLAYQYWTMN